MFKLEIKTGNAAFRDEDAPEGDEGDEAHRSACENEIARILREVAGDIERGRTEGQHSVFDANGNRVGHYQLTGED